MKNSKRPKIYLGFKIAGISLIVVGIILLVVGLTRNVPDMGSADWFNSNSLKMGLMFGGIVCFMFGIVSLIIGFSPKIQKTMIKTQKYIMNENQEDLKDIADINANIHKDSIKTVAKSVKEGMEKDTKFCINCGKEIDKEAKFCPECGVEQ